jgi:hypothetical protein
MAELEAGLDGIESSPQSAGPLLLIVARPKRNARQVLHEAELSVSEGLVGDSWRLRRGFRGYRPPDVNRQLTVMSSRVIALIAGHESRWPLAGDQLYVDLDLSQRNLPPGTELEIGGAVIVVTPPPHLGCKKFVERFGNDAMQFVNSELGRGLNLRGINARVIRAGTVRVGDLATKRA